MLHFITQLQPLAGSLRRDVVEGNFYSATLAGDHCFDVLDLHFHFRHAVYSTVTGTVSTGTSMPTATSHTCF